MGFDATPWPAGIRRRIWHVFLDVYDDWLAGGEAACRNILHTAPGSSFLHYLDLGAAQHKDRRISRIG